jgi:hypothetical protein
MAENPGFGAPRPRRRASFVRVRAIVANVVASPATWLFAGRALHGTRAAEQPRLSPTAAGNVTGRRGTDFMDAHALGLLDIVIRTVAAHTVTYTVVGIAAMNVFRYNRAIRDDPVRRATLRDTSSPWVMAGPLLQPLRGALFGIVFYLLRDTLFAPDGWLVLWIMLVSVGILGTFAPAPSSIEGWIYLEPSAKGPLWGGLVEVLTQSLLLSVVSFLWITHPAAAWLDWVLGILFVLSLAMPALGLAAARGARRST